MLKPLLILSLVALIACPIVAQPGPRPKKQEKSPVDLTRLPPPADRKNVTYAADLKGVFDNSCVRCHGTEKPKARLRLDSLEAILKGSEHGQVVVPGSAKSSPLLVNIARIGDPDEFMPPTRNKAGIGPLSTEQVSLVRAWIEQGAK